MGHVRLVGWLWVVASLVISGAALAGMVYFLTAEDDQTAGELLFLAIATAPGVPAGFWLLRRQRWARFVLLFEAVMVLIAVPVGTALGVYTIWVLLVRNDSVAVFSRRSGAASNR